MFLSLFFKLNILLFRHTIFIHEFKNLTIIFCDGSDDILWRKAIDGTVKVAISGRVNIGYTDEFGSYDGVLIGGQVRVENLDAKFSAWSHQLADYNGDGRADILWHRKDNGEVKLAISNAQGNQQSMKMMAAKASGWSLVH